jgi:2-oxoglutarate ferredoxin oxidoreductase subunit alpha
VDRVANDIPDVVPWGSENGGRLLVIGWGSTYGSIRQAVQIARERGLDVSHAHLRHLNPFPKNLGDVLTRYEEVLCPEMNMGQLSMLMRAKYLVDVKSHTKIQGKPFKVGEILQRIDTMLG